MQSPRQQQETAHAEARSSLTPSQQVLLTSDAGMAAALAQAALAAAVLANEGVGALRLRTERRSALFGLLRRTVAVAEPGATAPQWPQGTLEAGIALHLADGPLQVQEVLYRVLGEDTADASLHTLEVIRRALLERGLLERAERTHMRVFTTSVYRLAPGAAELAAQQSPDGAQRLLDACQRERPELWKALCAQIGQAFARRTKSDDRQGWTE